jgi:putative transcriptional regulator
MEKLKNRATRRSKASPAKKDRLQVPRSRFKQLRLQKDVPRAQMASELKVSDVTIKHLETGENDPSFMMAFVYAFYFGATIEELFPDIYEDARKYFETLKADFGRT